MFINMIIVIIYFLIHIVLLIRFININFKIIYWCIYKGIHYNSGDFNSEVSLNKVLLFKLF